MENIYGEIIDNCAPLFRGIDDTIYKNVEKSTVERIMVPTIKDTNEIIFSNIVSSIRWFMMVSR